MAYTFEMFLEAIDDYKEATHLFSKHVRIAKHNYLKMVGEGINSWHDFLAQPEVGMTVREANGLIKLEEWLHATKLPFKELNLATAKFAANKGILDAELHEDMKVLSLKDFKERHHEEKTNDAPQTFEYMVMKRSKETGNLSRVYGVEDLEETIKKRIDE